MSSHRSGVAIARQTLYVVAFVVLMALASFSYLNQHASADVAPSSPYDTVPNNTVPPPGDTIAPTAARVKVVHVASFTTTVTTTVAAAGVTSCAGGDAACGVLGGQGAGFFASPSATNAAVKVIISDTINLYQIGNLPLGQVNAGYLSVEPGVVYFDVKPTNALTPTLSVTKTLLAGRDYTAALIGGVNGWPLDLLLLTDDNTAPPLSNGKVRVVHAAPFSPTLAGTTVDVLTVADQTIHANLEDMMYQDNSGYLVLPATAYYWKVVVDSDSSTLLNVPTFDVTDGAILTLFILGDSLNQPAAALLIVEKTGATRMFFPIIRKLP